MSHPWPVSAIIIQGIYLLEFYDGHGEGGFTFPGQNVRTKADSYGNEKLKQKWPKSVCFFGDQKYGQSQSYLG